MELELHIGLKLSVILTDPLLPPLQLTFVTLVNVTVEPELLTVEANVLVQLLKSVMVTIKDPAPRPEIS